MESREKNVTAVECTVTVDSIDLNNLESNGAEIHEAGKAKVEKRKLKDLDDLFPYIGEFGWYQRFLFLMMLPYGTFFAVVYFAQIFMTLTPAEHWCRVPELANFTVEQRRHLSIPRLEDGTYDKCRMYEADWVNVVSSGISEPDSKWLTTTCHYGYEFNFTDVPYETISTQIFHTVVLGVISMDFIFISLFPLAQAEKLKRELQTPIILGWVCENGDNVATGQAVFFCGAILGGLLFGYLADKFGRVPALFGANMAALVGGLGTAFCNSFWTFCLCRFIVGLAYDNCFMIIYIVLVEYVGPNYRTLVANLSFGIFFTAAACSLPWIALAAADWKFYSLVTSAPLILAIFTRWIVPESARWLISQGRIEEAIIILNKFERINKRYIPNEIMDEFRETAVELQKKEQEAKNYSVLDLFRSPRLRRHTILLVVVWASIAMVFDGHVRSAGAFGLDMFLTFTVATATEFPADVLLIILLDYTGRRWLTCSTMTIGGLFCFIVILVPFGVPSAISGIIGRFAVNIAYNIGMQFAAELLPTVARAQGLGLVHIAGYIASVVVPYIIYLGTFASFVPLVVLGCLGIIGGTLCLLLPDTTGEAMPQTLQDGEQFGLGQRFWDIPFLKKMQNWSKDTPKSDNERIEKANDV